MALVVSEGMGALGMNMLCVGGQIGWAMVVGEVRGQPVCSFGQCRECKVVIRMPVCEVE